VLCAAVAFAVAAVLLPGVAGAQSASQLEDVKQRVDRVTEQLEAARGDAQAARAALAAADADLAEVEVRVNEAAAAVTAQEAAVTLAAERLERLRADVEALEAAFEARAVELFKNGSVQSFEVLLAAGDLQDAIDRTGFIERISGTGRDDLEAVQASRVALQAEAERFEAERERLEELREEEEALLAEVQRVRDAQAAALGDARVEVDSLASQRDDLSAEAERIERLIEEARSTPVATTTPSSGGYIWPVCKRVTSNFGYRWGRLHAGTDIDGNTGDPIGAAKAGVVISAGYQGGYGYLVLIDHGDGVVTAYAHQSQILVSSGQSVRRGERIGLIGNTGQSTGSHLHFETRVNGSAVDPRRFLPGGC